MASREARCDSVAERDHSPKFAFLLGHRAWKGVAQAFDHLEERQIDVGNSVADEDAAAVAPQYCSYRGTGLEKLLSLDLFR